MDPGRFTSGASPSIIEEKRNEWRPNAARSQGPDTLRARSRIRVGLLVGWGFSRMGWAGERRRAGEPRRAREVADLRRATGRAWPFGLLALILLGTASPAVAQAISGTVTDVRTGSGVAQAELLLINEAGNTVGRGQTDADGTFRIDAPVPGDFTLRIEHLSFAPFTSETLALERGETTLVQVRLAVQVIELEPLEVVGRRYMDNPRLRQFYNRADQNVRRGRGRVYFREDLDRMADIGEIFYDVPRQPSANVLSRVGCRFDYFVDGLPMGAPEYGIRSMGSPTLFEGIEVYWGMSIPIQYRQDPSTCGVVLFWNRPAAKPFTWGRTLVAAGLAGLLILFF